MERREKAEEGGRGRRERVMMLREEKGGRTVCTEVREREREGERERESEREKGKKRKRQQGRERRGGHGNCL